MIFILSLTFLTFCASIVGVMTKIENSPSERATNKNRLKRTLALTGSVLAFAGVAEVGAHGLPGQGKTVNVPEVIQPHDTLWSAVERADKKMHVSVDPRDEVYRLADELGTTVVTPGEHITVHVRK